MVEVAYMQYVIPVKLNINLPMMLIDAIQKSGILKICPEIDLKHNKTGIFGEIRPLDTRLKDGDRIEIYREILIFNHPMTKRFERVKKRRKGQKTGC